MKIKFNELHSEINERKGKIQVLQEQQNRLLEVDEKNKVMISAENKAHAVQIAAALKELRRKNDEEQGLLEKAKEISARWNVDFDELHQLKLSIPAMEKQVQEMTQNITEWQNIDPSFEKQKSSKNSPFYNKMQALDRARQALLNHQGAQKELAAIMGGMKL